MTAFEAKKQAILHRIERAGRDPYESARAAEAKRIEEAKAKVGHTGQVVELKPAARTPEREAFDNAVAAERARLVEEDVEEVVRTSQKLPGITLKRQGRFILIEWKTGGRTSWMQFFIYQGHAYILEAPPKSTLPRTAEPHIISTLALYIQKLAA